MSMRVGSEDRDDDRARLAGFEFAQHVCATHVRNGCLVWIAVDEPWSVVDRMLYVGRREGDASGIGEVIAE